MGRGEGGKKEERKDGGEGEAVSSGGTERCGAARRPRAAPRYRAGLRPRPRPGGGNERGRSAGAARWQRGDPLPVGPHFPPRIGSAAPRLRDAG